MVLIAAWVHIGNTILFFPENFFLGVNESYKGSNETITIKRKYYEGLLAAWREKYHFPRTHAAM